MWGVMFGKASRVPCSEKKPGKKGGQTTFFTNVSGHENVKTWSAPYYLSELKW
jgi:hypothetical protein